MKTKTRKLIWSVPLVATLAVVGALAAFVALAAMPGTSSAADGDNTTPDAPTRLTATAGNERISASWVPPRESRGELGIDDKPIAGLCRAVSDAGRE